jgi:methylmalonyl-CoA mutase cobalamin-binding subunit
MSSHKRPKATCITCVRTAAHHVVVFALVGHAAELGARVVVELRAAGCECCCVFVLGGAKRRLRDAIAAVVEAHSTQNETTRTCSSIMSRS